MTFCLPILLNNEREGEDNDKDIDDIDGFVDDDDDDIPSNSLRNVDKTRDCTDEAFPESSLELL
jgi:hypothetical protein